MATTNTITALTIPGDAINIFQAHDIIDTLSNYEGTENAIYAIEDWAAENAAAWAEKHANEGNHDDAAALLEIYNGDGADDDNWADVISAIDRARTNEWAGCNWLEIKTRTVPVTSEENLHEIERAAAISGLTVTDYGVDDDGRPTDATIMGTADNVKILDELAESFNTPTKVRLVATPGNFHDPADDDAPEEAAPIKAEEILREEDPEYRTWDDALIWLDGDRAGWNVVEEAARIASLPTYKTNLHAAVRAYGMAEALAIAARIEGANADWWLGFIEDFSADNYDNGARIEE